MIARDVRRDATLTSAAAPARASLVRWLIAILGAVALVGTGGCGNSAPHGPPVLQQVYWETRGGVQTLAWTSVPADAEVATLVSPAATQFDLVLDRVIDGSKIEDTVTVNGISTQHSKPTGMPPAALTMGMSPVVVTWPDMETALAKLQAELPVQPYSLAVWYNSIHFPIAPANTAYVYGRELPSYPSNTAISICIDPNGITSEYGEPMAPLPAGMSSDCSVDGASGKPLTGITITTAPFSVAINPPPAGTTAPAGTTPTYVPTNFWVPLQFNNIPVDPATQLGQYVQVRQNGVVLAAGQYLLQPSASDPTLILLQPGSIQIWDSGAQLDVTVSADLPDIYGAVLGTEATASFIACQLVSEDAGVHICAPPNHPGTDGGASDGGVSDAGASDADDASASIDAPVDADTDAAVEAGDDTSD